MSIGQVKWQSVVAKYAYPETWRSLWQVANSVIPFFVFWYLAYFSLEVGYWLTLLLTIPLRVSWCECSSSSTIAVTVLFSRQN